MKYSEREIVRALNIIKETCQSTTCADCPFYNEFKCGICDESPEDWNIVEPEKQIFRAFKGN